MHNRLRGLNSKKIRAILKHWGFKKVGQEGSHEDWEKVEKGRTVAVTVVANQKDYPRGTLLSIFDQSEKTQEEWLKALDEV